MMKNGEFKKAEISFSLSFFQTEVDSMSGRITVYPQHQGYESTAHHSRDSSESIRYADFSHALVWWFFYFCNITNVDTASVSLHDYTAGPSFTTGRSVLLSQHFISVLWELKMIRFRMLLPQMVHAGCNGGWRINNEDVYSILSWCFNFVFFRIMCPLYK